MAGPERDAGRCTVRYAGIGSREAPTEVLALMESLAAQLARRGWVLRTGASPGSDQAFYRGARSAAGRVELYLPWAGFESGSWGPAESGEVEVLAAPSPQAHELAARFQPRWASLGDEQRRLLARDAHQVLGADLASPARVVVCWTADGSLDGSGAGADGTRQALRIARDRGIPVLNLARSEHVQVLTDTQPDGCVC
jgi:hypothetical protein